MIDDGHSLAGDRAPGVPRVDRRTPIGRFRGALAGHSGTEAAVSGARKRNTGGAPVCLTTIPTSPWW